MLANFGVYMVYMHCDSCVHLCTHVWGSEDNVWESVLTVYRVGLED